MQRKFLLSALAAALIATGGFAIAQQAAPPAPAAAPTAHAMKMDGHHGWKGPRGAHRHGMHRMGRHGPAGAVIGSLHQLSRMYVMSGKADQLPALYKDVLSRTQDPMVRNYAYRALARAEMRPRDTSAAIATMRKSLDENLARLNAKQTAK